MTTETRYMFMVSMDVDADKEALFNEVYDTEHVPYLLQVDGVRAVTRTENVPFEVSIGGEVKRVALTDEPKHCAIYELDSPEVLTSAGWAQAVEKGRWAEQVRPFTHNRRHVLRKVTIKS